MTTTVRPPRRRPVAPPRTRVDAYPRDGARRKKAPSASRPRIRRPRPAKPAGRRSSLFVGLFALIVILNLVGLVMVLSASAVGRTRSTARPGTSSSASCSGSCSVRSRSIVTMRIDYHVWRRRAPLFLVGAIGPAGARARARPRSRGERRVAWLGFGNFRIQPSEIAKLALLLFVADLLARRAHRIDDTRLTLRPVLVVFLVVAGLIMLQPNLGTTIILGVIVFVMLFVAGVPLKPLGLTAAGGGAAAVMFAVVEPYRYRRLMAFRDPGPTRSTPATRRSSRRSASPTAASSARASAPAGPSGASCPSPTPTSSSPSSPRSSVWSARSR